MFRTIILPNFRSTRLCVTACGIMHPRCCRPPATGRCSFLPCLSWLLRSRVRKSRRDLWITLYICYFCLHMTSGRFGVVIVMIPQVGFVGCVIWRHRINIMLYTYFVTWLYLIWAAYNFTQYLWLSVETQCICRALVRANQWVLL